MHAIGYSLARHFASTQYDIRKNFKCLYNKLMLYAHMTDALVNLVTSLLRCCM